MRKLKTKLLSLFLVSLLVLTVGMVFSDEAQGVKGKIYTNGGRYFKKQGYFIFKDYPRMEYKDYIITSEIIEYYEDEERAVFTGDVVVLQKDNRITGQKMDADLNKDEFVIEEDVYIYYVRKSKDDQQQTTEEKKENQIIEIHADHVVYLSDENDYLTATGRAKLDTDDRKIKADYLEYIGDQEIVIARDNVEVLGKDEEKLFCQEFTYILDGEEEGFTAIGEVELEFTIDDQDEKEDDSETAHETQTSQGDGE